MVGDYSRESKAEKDISLLRRGAWGPPGIETQVEGITMWPSRTQTAWRAGPLSPGCCEVGKGQAVKPWQRVAMKCPGDKKVLCGPWGL